MGAEPRKSTTAWVIIHRVSVTERQEVGSKETGAWVELTGYLAVWHSARQ